MADPNLPMLEDAASKLTPFLDEIVFVGGITLGLLITDTAAAPIRGTIDVDVIAQILTYADYIEFSERLRKAKFTEDSGERPLTCRWHNGELTLDVLALRKEALGFTNAWYEGAMKHACAYTLPSGTSIRIITAPFFLGTKIEAFRDRGKMDFAASHDLEDFVAIIEGRDSLLKEIADSPIALQKYLAETAEQLLAEPRFLDVLPGFVLDAERVPLIIERLKNIKSQYG
jgi:hypothetical protein